jgi:hypothetical protein
MAYTLNAFRMDEVLLIMEYQQPAFPAAIPVFDWAGGALGETNEFPVDARSTTQTRL